MNCYGSGCFNDAEPGTTFCPECQLKNEEKKKQAQLERIATIEKVWHGEDVKWNDLQPPKKYHGATWSTLSPAVQNQITPFIVGDADLLTFIGCPGAGKSWAAWAAVGVFLVNHVETYFYNHNRLGYHFFTNWYALNETARDSRLYGEEGEENRSWLERWRAAELLVIDEFATARPYEAEFMGVMRIIHHRFDNGLPTILITTKNEQQISELIGEAMVSRMNSGIMVRMQGRDRRLPT